MDRVDAPAQSRVHEIEFRGTGGEYFGIWIVNLVLTLLTIGIYGAWAKVRTQRYFNGNTFIGAHALDYHASAWRILLGRLIAVAFLVGYEVTIATASKWALVWVVIFLVAFPWLINSSLRFAARNTSYRNVRFNFDATYVDALKAYVLWPLAATVSLFTLVPFARRKRDYFYVNFHTFGGRRFRTQFPVWRIYAIYLVALVILLAFAGSVGALVLKIGLLSAKPAAIKQAIAAQLPLFFIVYIVFLLLLTVLPIVVNTMVFNLSIGNMVLDEKHKFESRVSPLAMAWIAVTNTLGMLFTLGLFYPWARVRLVRYQASRIRLLAATDLDEFTSEVIATQGAIGEEIAAFFDLNIGL